MNMNEIESSFYKSFFDTPRSGIILKGDGWSSKIETKKYDLCPELGERLFITMDMCGESITGDILLIPQYTIKQYRLDFVMSGYLEGAPTIGIEIDGHQWHEKTKQQAIRDKKREREIVSCGIPIIRYTGSEIFKKPSESVIEAIKCKIVFAYNVWSDRMEDRI
jgi:very-short-patch-repair endonuclease